MDHTDSPAAKVPPDPAPALEAIPDSTQDYAIVTLDDDGMITSWNPGAERLFGYARGEALGCPGAMLFTAADRTARVPEDEIHRARLYGRAEDERWHRRKDGSTFYCSGVMTRLTTHPGTGLGFVKIARDLTSGKYQEQRREAQLLHERLERIQAQARNALKDEFLAIMSHELKHPLNLIHVNAELLVRAPEVQGAPAVLRAAENIRRTVQGQAKIIDDLLDLSRMQSGKLALNRDRVDWREVTRSIVEAVRVDAGNRHLQLEFQPGNEPVLVFADPVRVEQIVWNLVSNALKFTPAGGRVTVVLEQNAHQASLTVSDTGQGIDADSLPHIFDMFRQAESRAARHEGGLGIGLALIRQLADAHGGSVAAHSAGPGKGASFTVRLPRYAANPAAGAPGRGADGALNGLRILMVEDTVDTLEAFGELLRLEGAQFHAAAGGEEALATLAQLECDLILSDIVMPGMDGYELMRRVRADPRLAHIPAIALSGFGRDDDARRALEAGFSAHLAKPVSLPALIGAVRDIGARRPGTPPARPAG